jgi:hypothetical protein
MYVGNATFDRLSELIRKNDSDHFYRIPVCLRKPGKMPGFPGGLILIILTLVILILVILILVILTLVILILVVSILVILILMILILVILILVILILAILICQVLIYTDHFENPCKILYSS